MRGFESYTAYQIMKCKYHLCEVDAGTRKNKVYCSKNCCVKDRCMRLRKEFKEKAVQLLGGKCAVCGYDRCIKALQFHHTEPKHKLFGLGDGRIRSWERYWTEVQKCELLCANCHFEKEAEIYRGVAQSAQQMVVTHPFTGSNPVAPAIL